MDQDGIEEVDRLINDMMEEAPELMAAGDAERKARQEQDEKILELFRDEDNEDYGAAR